MKNYWKEVIVFPYDDPSRCPVHRVDKYCGLCPTFYKKKNFYIQSFKKPTQALWYGYQVIGEKSIRKIIRNLMSKAGYTGHFTGHSLRRSGVTCLSNAGVPKKIIHGVYRP